MTPNQTKSVDEKQYCIACDSEHRYSIQVDRSTIIAKNELLESKVKKLEEMLKIADEYIVVSNSIINGATTARKQRDRSRDLAVTYSEMKEKL